MRNVGVGDLEGVDDGTKGEFELRHVISKFELAGFTYRAQNTCVLNEEVYEMREERDKPFVSRMNIVAKHAVGEKVAVIKYQDFNSSHTTNFAIKWD